jgi:predicted transcriptional regulator
MAQVTIDVDDDVLRLVDDVASRVGLPREAVIARAVRQDTAATVLAELFRGRRDGLSDDEAAQVIEGERAVMRAERRAGGPTRN